ncbi:hypothetical protein [Pseudomonas sp. CGJS7]|uniref:hypothetical protein n=1 Tax=Pseudomonas sp. CGJS7 TaxID=3109348 RepID=UPI00300B718A
MKMRKLTLAAAAVFVFAASTVALARPPLGSCQECRIAYNVCMYESHGQHDGECEAEFSRCLIGAGCPLE